MHYLVKDYQKILIHVLLLTIYSISLLACTGTSNLITLDQKDSVHSTQTASFQEKYPSQTPVVALAKTPLNQGQKTATLPPTPLSEPISFTFPTNQPDPGPDWHPPLYPTPWEPTPYDHFYFIRPIGANEQNAPLARYRYGGMFYGMAHTGIDIPSPVGTPILAAGSGTVIWAGYGLYFLRQEYQDPYGIAVAIKHDFGYQGKSLYTVYGHLSETYVWRGQHIEGGDIIGLIGLTGKTSGPHLHFEVRIGDNKVFGSRNPELWISPPQGWGIFSARIMDTDGNLMKQKKINLRSNETDKLYYVDTYGKGAVNSDEYYQENAVLGDLPTGIYTIWIDDNGMINETEIQILPGRVTSIKYWGKYGFDHTLPKEITKEFIAPDATPSSTLDR
jgi:murein DD-endopeptidase MepM/ murein hydrolase activator NlpD